MAQHALCMKDNDGNFSVICEILDNNLEEWKKLAEFLTDRNRKVAGGCAELSAYTSWYQLQIDGSDHWYKFGEYPTVLVMEKNGNVYTYDEYEYESHEIWDIDDIVEFCTEKYDGGIWKLGLNEVPDLLRKCK